MKLKHVIRKVSLTSISLTLTVYSSFGSSIPFAPLLRRTSSSVSTYVSQASSSNTVRFCSTLPKGFKLIEISQEGLAPWSDSKQKLYSPETKPIDVTKFFADRERGLLYQFQSWKELETEKEERLLPFKTKLETLNRCSDQSGLSDLSESMGLVESIFDLESGQIRILGAGIMIRPDAVLTAARNLAIDPEDSLVVKKATNAKAVEFLLKYDAGKPLKTLRVSGYKVPNEWLFGRDAAYNFAVLFLENSEKTPKIKLASIEKWLDFPIQTNVAGYPREILEKSGSRVINSPLSSYAYSSEIKNISDCNRFINYTGFSEEGMGGGPVLIRDFPTVVVGVHTTGSGVLNRGVYPADHMVRYLNKWFSEHKKPNRYVDDDILKTIRELSKSDEEEEYLNSNIHVLREYPIENIRSHLGFMLHTLRFKRNH